MKIGILTPQSLPIVGGLQIAVDAIAGGLVDSGFQVRLFTPTDSSAEKYSYPVIQIKGLPPFYPVPLENMPILEKGLEDFLEKEYQKDPFDLLHAHISYPTGLCALNWGKRKRVPVIITCHGIDVIGRPEDYYGFLLDTHLASKVSACLSQAPYLTIISSHLKQHLLSLGASEEAIHIIPNGVFPENFHNTKQHAQEHPYILAMGCLHHIKGFDTLLEAFALAQEKVAEMRLIIAGEGPDKRKLIEKSFQAKLKGKVEFLPFLRGEEKNRSLGGCRFVVCPSRYESFGMVVLEANAAGKPVLGFSVGGLRELIRHEENGWLIPPGDLVGLASGMIKLWRREICFPKAHLIEAANNYNWKKVVQKYISLYQSILSNAG
jgi:glycosyltransferase involved in cell wall biosynthesis